MSRSPTLPDRVALTTEDSTAAGTPTWIAAPGIGLFLGAVAWTFVSAGAVTLDAVTVAGVIIAAGAAIMVGLVASRRVPWSVPLAVVGLAAAVALVDPIATFTDTAAGGPLGYANAEGAFFAQASIAGLMLLALGGSTRLRVIGGTAAVVFAAVPIVSQSYAAVIVLAALAPITFAVRRPRAARIVVAACGALFLAALAATILIGGLTSITGDESGRVGRLVDATLTEERVVLWRESLVLIRREPVTGFGPGSFRALSPTAREDADFRWAHHGFLQQGAEQGIPALVLAVLLFMWGFAALWLHPSPDRVTALGAVALAALGIHASVDYVLHFPVVPASAAALVGVGLAVRKRRQDAGSGSDA